MLIYFSFSPFWSASDPVGWSEVLFWWWVMWIRQRCSPLKKTPSKLKTYNKTIIYICRPKFWNCFVELYFCCLCGFIFPTGIIKLRFLGTLECVFLFVDLSFMMFLLYKPYGFPGLGTHFFVVLEVSRDVTLNNF